MLGTYVGRVVGEIDGILVGTLVGKFEGFEVMGLLDEGSEFGNKVGFDIDGDFRKGFTVGC